MPLVRVTSKVAARSWASWAFPVAVGEGTQPRARGGGEALQLRGIPRDGDLGVRHGDGAVIEEGDQPGLREAGELDVEEGAGEAQLLEGHPTGLGEADECLVESKAWVGRACPTLDRAHLARPPAEVTDFRHCP